MARSLRTPLSREAWTSGLFLSAGPTSALVIWMLVDGDTSVVAWVGLLVVSVAMAIASAWLFERTERAHHSGTLTSSRPLP